MTNSRGHGQRSPPCSVSVWCDATVDMLRGQGDVETAAIGHRQIYVEMSMALIAMDSERVAVRTTLKPAFYQARSAAISLSSTGSHDRAVASLEVPTITCRKTPISVILPDSTCKFL